MKSAYFALFVLVGCVGDDSVAGKDASPDVTTNEAGVDAPVADVTSQDVDAGPAPCGYPGEDCCVAPFAPCNDGLTCSTSSPKKCMVNEAWAVGTYDAVASGQTFPDTEIVVAHYDGVSWTAGTPVKLIPFDFNSYDAVDVYELGTNVRVITIEADKGHEYTWNGVVWQECKLGNSCVGPTMNADVYAITSVTNSGSNDYWLAGTNMMFRCANGASSCVSVTNGIPGNWGQGAFAGQTGQDLWYSQFDHVLHFDGTQWSSMTVADAYTIGDVGTNDLWIGQKQLRHWDGTAWSNAFLVGGSQTPGTILSIGGSGSKDVHAVGNDQTQSGGSFDAHWDGTGWKLATLPAGISHVQKVWAPSPIEAFIVGPSSTIDNKGVFARWDGTSWKTMPPPTVTMPNESAPGGVSWVSVHGQARPRRK